MFEFVQMMQRVTLHLTPGSRGQASRQLAAAAYSRFLQISLFSDISHYGNCQHCVTAARQDKG